MATSRGKVCDMGGFRGVGDVPPADAWSPECDVAAERAGKDVRGLAEPCDASTQVSGTGMVHRFAAKPDDAVIGRRKARDKRQQGGFSATARGHHRDMFAGVDG